MPVSTLEQFQGRCERKYFSYLIHDLGFLTELGDKLVSRGRISGASANGGAVRAFGCVP